MKADKNDKLKTLLKQTGTDQPAEGFTESVMNIIEADAVRETALKSLLKQHPAEGPSFDFTALVMRQISDQPKPLVVQPIIPRKAWFAIAAMITIFLSVIAFSPSQVNTDPLAGDKHITMLIDQLQAIPSTYVLAVVVIAGLLLADYLITQRNRTTVIH